MFQYFSGLRIFSLFYLKKRLCSNIFLDLEYFPNFPRKNDYVSPFFWTWSIFLISLGKNDYVPLFFWTWNIFLISIEKKKLRLSPAKHWNLVAFSNKNVRIFEVQQNIGTQSFSQIKMWKYSKSRKIVEHSRFFKQKCGNVQKNSGT